MIVYILHDANDPEIYGVYTSLEEAKAILPVVWTSHAGPPEYWYAGAQGNGLSDHVPDLYITQRVIGDTLFLGDLL